MPMTVITVTNAPPSLRGDLTKWLQEIAPGVYIGNFNKRIREKLWNRIKENIGKGQATLSYHHRNELGYLFETFQNKRSAIDYDGIQLVLYPLSEKVNEKEESMGFSNAAKRRKAKKYSNIIKGSIKPMYNYVVLDIETDGLDKEINHIIEIGMVKVRDGKIDTKEIRIYRNLPLPKSITKLTGITEEMLKEEGVSIVEALNQATAFLGDLPIVGYSVDFDISFINKELKKLGKEPLKNRSYDILKYVKREKMFLDNYRFETVIHAYGMKEKVKHRGLSDALQIHELTTKVKGFLDKVKK